MEQQRQGLPQNFKSVKDLLKVQETAKARKAILKIKTIDFFQTGLDYANKYIFDEDGQYYLVQEQKKREGADKLSMTSISSSPSSVYYQEEDDNDNAAEWTSDYLIDRLKQFLAAIENTSITEDEKRKFHEKWGFYESRKYYYQAYNLLKIGAFKPVLPFIINLSDLTPRLLKELYKLDHEDRDYVLRQAVGRIFEDVNFKLYHNSISKVFKVRLE
jgi:hypothetical protein